MNRIKSNCAKYGINDLTDMPSAVSYSLAAFSTSRMHGMSPKNDLKCAKCFEGDGADVLTSTHKQG